MYLILGQCKNFEIEGKNIAVQVSIRTENVKWLMGWTKIVFKNGKSCKCENKDNYWLQHSKYCYWPNPWCNYVVKTDIICKCSVWLHRVNISQFQMVNDPKNIFD